MIYVVLILVVVDDGLVHMCKYEERLYTKCLNPCCSGRWSRTAIILVFHLWLIVVLILVVVDDGLVLIFILLMLRVLVVLILVVVDDGLVHKSIL